MLTRLIAAGLLAGAALGGCVLYALRLGRRGRLLSELGAAFALLAERESPDFSDPRKRLARGPQTPFVSLLLSLWEPGEDPGPAWAAAAGGETFGPLLTAEERAALTAFPEALARPSAAAYARACAAASARFAGAARTEKRDRLRRQRLAVSFGALGAALAVILAV